MVPLIGSSFPAQQPQESLVRVCRKLVLHGQAHDKGADYTLYLKVSL